MGPARPALATLVSIPAALLLAYVMRPADDFMVRFGARLNIVLLVLLAAGGITAAAASGWRSGVIQVAGVYLVLRLAHAGLNWRCGGITRGGFLATVAALEVWTMLILTMVK